MNRDVFIWKERKKWITGRARTKKQKLKNPCAFMPTKAIDLADLAHFAVAKITGLSRFHLWRLCYTSLSCSS